MAVFSRSGEFSIPPLNSGGLMLTYRCTNTCKHCLYRCSPQKEDKWITDEVAEKVFTALAREKSLYGIHIAGGEATLNMDLLCRVLDLARKYHIHVDYLETNGYWAADTDKAKERFKKLWKHGLNAVLISASFFHNEFIPFKRTRNAIEAAVDVFGRSGVIVWTPNVYNLLQRVDDDRVHKVEELCQELDVNTGDLARIHSYLTPGGRVVEELADCYTKHDAAFFRGDNCASTLQNTGHFHIDPSGNLFTGLCPGISVGNADNFHPGITDEKFPAFSILCREGSVGLMDRAVDKYGYSVRADGYVSKCDLCLDVRKHLREKADFTEIRPDEFYS